MCRRCTDPENLLLSSWLAVDDILHYRSTIVKYRWWLGTFLLHFRSPGNNSCNFHCGDRRSYTRETHPDTPIYSAMGTAYSDNLSTFLCCSTAQMDSKLRFSENTIRSNSCNFPGWVRMFCIKERLGCSPDRWRKQPYRLDMILHRWRSMLGCSLEHISCSDEFRG